MVCLRCGPRRLTGARLSRGEILPERSRPPAGRFPDQGGAVTVRPYGLMCGRLADHRGPIRPRQRHSCRSRTPGRRGRHSGTVNAADAAGQQQLAAADPEPSAAKSSEGQRVRAFACTSIRRGWGSWTQDLDQFPPDRLFPWNPPSAPPSQTVVTPTRVRTSSTANSSSAPGVNGSEVQVDIELSPAASQLAGLRAAVVAAVSAVPVAPCAPGAGQPASSPTPVPRGVQRLLPGRQNIIAVASGKAAWANHRRLALALAAERCPSIGVLDADIYSTSLDAGRASGGPSRSTARPWTQARPGLQLNSIRLRGRRHQALIWRGPGPPERWSNCCARRAGKGPRLPHHRHAPRHRRHRPRAFSQHVPRHRGRHRHHPQDIALIDAKEGPQDVRSPLSSASSRT